MLLNHIQGDNQHHMIINWTVSRKQEGLLSEEYSWDSAMKPHVITAVVIFRKKSFMQQFDKH